MMDKQVTNCTYITEHTCNCIYRTRYFASSSFSLNGMLLATETDPLEATNFNKEMQTATPGTETTALVEIEIVTRTVSEVLRQRKFTFIDQVGTLGKLQLLTLAELLELSNVLLRWNPGIIYWHEHPEHV